MTVNKERLKSCRKVKIELIWTIMQSEEYEYMEPHGDV